MVSASPPTSPFVFDLRDPRVPDRAMIGAKAQTLARLAAAGFDVPEAFVLSTDAFRRLVAGLSDPSPAAVKAAPLPAGVEEALLQISARLDGVPLAVRSSAVAEDQAHASYAGQYASVLGVRGPERLVDAVRECWSSAFTSHAKAYRTARGTAAVSLAVIVQRQIDPRAAGVAFSADPVSGDRGVAVVNAVHGLGDRMAAGAVTPEEWRVAGGEARLTSGSMGALTGSEAVAVARLAGDIEAEDGRPQDIEWALDGERLWLLQARPITARSAATPPVAVPVEAPEGFWQRDASHFPAPVSPLARTTVYPIANAVSPSLFQEYGMLGEGLQLTDIGGWHYIRTVPIGGRDRKPPPAPLLAIMARLHPVMRQRRKAARAVVREGQASRVIERWWGDWQTVLSGRADALMRIELPSLSDDELLAHVEACLDLMRDGMRSHVLVLGAVMVETHPLLAACHDLLGWDAASALDLVTGLSFRSTDPARQLAKLAGRFRDEPDALAELERIDEGTIERLAAIDPTLVAEFEAYRWSYGARGLSRDPADPTIADRPELLLQMISAQLSSGFDPDAPDRENGARRAATRERANAALSTRSAADSARFEDALARAERAYPLREDNVFVALQAPVGVLRYAALEAGRRLAERGQLDQPADVFFLEYQEARAALSDGSEQPAVVRKRMGERAWVQAHPGPAIYGTPPGPPPSLVVLPGELREVTEAFLSFMSLAIDAGGNGAHTDGIVRGVAGSPGNYTGPVRVVLDESQFHKIRAGDVVVCPVTQPTWSVVFPSIGAVVADSGGILSHSAIIAREYRLPAVVATGDGTSLLRDDQLVTVDGSAGTVQIVGGP